VKGGFDKFGNVDVHALRDDFAGAARAGDIIAAHEILEQFGSANVIADPDGRTMLMVAAQHGSLEICEMLLKRGADVNAGDRYGRTALFLSVAHANICMAILARGGDASIGCVSEEAGATFPLEAAAAIDCLATCKVLIERSGASGGEPARLALLAAARAAHRGVINLIQAAWPDEVASHFNDMLVAAAAGGQCELCAQLLERGAASADALIEAVAHERGDVAQLLIDSGAGINAVGSAGLTALHDALQRGAGQWVSWLIEHGADVNANAGREGWTPVYSLIAGEASNRLELLKLLAVAGAGMRPEGSDRNSLTPFQYAVKLGRAELVRYFIGELNEDVTQKTFGGRTMLQLAGADGPTKQALVSAGAAVEAVSPTPNAPRPRSAGPLPF
jgi:ankyrin repeat protein